MYIFSLFILIQFLDFIKFWPYSISAIAIVRVLVPVILMILFSRPEFWCLEDFGDDVVREVALLFAYNIVDHCFLSIVLIHYGRSVLRSSVVALPVQRGWVMHLEEDDKQSVK